MTGEPVAVATVRRAHGLEGELLVHLETDHPEDVFARDRRLHVSGGGPVGLPGNLTLTSARPHGGGWVLGFAEIPDRTAAERYGGRHLFLQREELPDPGEDEFFLHELPGMQVRRENGTPVGRVDRVYETPGAPLLGVRAEGKERLIPFRREFVAGVDRERSVIRIRPPAGLLEL